MKILKILLILSVLSASFSIYCEQKAAGISMGFSF